MSTPNKGNWSNWFEFAFSCIGSMVGLGNVWRFPYICFKNGGGAFLIPYLIFMLTMAVPIMFVEFALGQYSSLGPAKVWLCCPLFKGVGYAMVVVAVMANSCYSSIISWTLFYFGNSFFLPLPWSSCNNEWNTPTCYFRTYLTEGNATGNMSFLNTTDTQPNVTLKAQTSSEEFWD